MVLTDASVTLASGCRQFFAKSTAFTSEKHSFEQFSETVQNTDWYLMWKCAERMTHLNVQFLTYMHMTLQSAGITYTN
jgi:hypothetical protein